MQRALAPLVLLLAACGGSPHHTAAPEARARGVLASIPADTSYVIATLRPYPLDGLRTQGGMWGKRLAELDEASLSPAERAHAAFAKVLFQALRGEGPLAGILPAGGAQYAMYGIELAPVVRIQVGDAQAARAALGRYFQAAQVAPEREQGREYFSFQANDDAQIVAAVADGQLVVAWLPRGRWKGALPHLLGITPPATSLADSGELSRIAGDDYDFVGRTDVKTVLALFERRESYLKPVFTLPFASIGGPACRSEVAALAGHTERLLIRTRMREDGIAASMLVELDPQVASDLMQLQVSLPGIDGRIPADSAWYLAIGLDSDHLFALLRRWGAALRREPLRCAELSFLNDLGILSPTMLPPVVQGLRGAAFVVQEGSLGQPGFRGYVAVYGGRVQALLATVQQYLQLGVPGNIPLDGTVVPVNMPANAASLTDVSLGATHEAFVLAAGKGAAGTISGILSARAEAPSPIASFGMDIDRMGKELPIESILSGAMADAFKAGGTLDMGLYVRPAGLELRMDMRLPPGALAKWNEAAETLPDDGNPPAASGPATPEPSSDTDVLVIPDDWTSGIASCDDYVRRMAKCLQSPKFPASARKQTIEAFRAMSDGYKQLSNAPPDAVRAAEEACRQATQGMHGAGDAMCPGVW